MPKGEREFKAAPALVLKVEAETGIVEALVNILGIIDLGNDVILSGAAAKTVTERGRKIRVLNSHNSWDVMSVVGVCLEAREIGRNELPAEILAEYPEATGAIWTKTQYLLDTPEGKGVFARIKAGAIDEYSIGFECLQWEMKDLGDGRYVRVIKEIKLWEFSAVIWGMNQATMTVGVKAANLSTFAQEMVQLANILQTENKAGRVLNSANADKLRLAAKQLLEVLDAAGIPLDTPDTVDSEDDSSKAEAGPQSVTPPAPTLSPDTVTEEKRKRLLALLDLENEGAS